MAALSVPESSTHTSSSAIPNTCTATRHTFECGPCPILVPAQKRARPSEALAARMVRRLRYSHCEENKLRAPFFRNLRPSFARSTWPRECRCRARRSPASSWGPGCWPRSSGRRPTRRGRRAWSWTRQKCFCPPVRMDPSTTTSPPLLPSSVVATRFARFSISSAFPPRLMSHLADALGPEVAGRDGVLDDESC